MGRKEGASVGVGRGGGFGLPAFLLFEMRVDRCLSDRKSVSRLGSWGEKSEHVQLRVG